MLSICKHAYDFASVCVCVYYSILSTIMSEFRGETHGITGGRSVGGVASVPDPVVLLGWKPCSFQNQWSNSMGGEIIEEMWDKCLREQKHVCQELPSSDTALKTILDPKTQANSKPLLSVKQIPSKRPSTHWFGLGENLQETMDLILQSRCKAAHCPFWPSPVWPCTPSCWRWSSPGCHDAGPRTQQDPIQPVQLQWRTAHAFLLTDSVVSFAKAS